jgi:hypothetical protein
MKKETAKKGNELLEEIEELKKYKKLLNSKEHGHCTHFEIVQHFGECKDYQKVKIERKHNDRLIIEIEKIIKELEAELEAL